MGHSQWERVHQGWGKEPDPSSRSPSPQELGCYFLTREPAIPVQPPSRPSALFSTATSSSRSSSKQHNLQASPAQPALFGASTAPCPHRNVRSRRSLSSQGGQGSRHTLRRRINTHTHSLVVSRPSLLLHALLISRSLLHSLVRRQHIHPAKLHRSNQSSPVSISRI